MIKNIIKKYNNKKGVSLVELVVSVAIFSLIAIVASGIFINAIKAQKSIIAKQKVADDMRYSADFMIKELRMAQAHPSDITLTFTNSGGVQLVSGNSPSASLSFFNSNGDNIVYSLSGGGSIVRNNLSGTAGDQSISSGEVEITGLSFYLNDWDLTRDAASSANPLIMVVIKAKARSGVGVEMDFQASVSPRIY